MESQVSDSTTLDQAKAEFLSWRKPTCDPILEAMRQSRRTAREQTEQFVSVAAGSVVVGNVDLLPQEND